jgi:wyosine [tRNA(Phe)-imidazoG37] synthetase (radical SAM superfamily)
MEQYKYIYGPVYSWRLGRSLGIDLLSQQEKICNFSCIYCQLGKTGEYTLERKIYVSTKSIIKELKNFLKAEIDYITFSGRGEPTLAKNLGEAIKAVKSLTNKPVAVITNSALINREDVRNELALADFVLAKLDAPSQQIFTIVNRPAANINYAAIVSGLKTFRKMYKGKFALQIMLVKQNAEYAENLIDTVNAICPDEVELNTPLRQSPVTPLNKSTILKIKKLFQAKCKNSIHIISVYDTREKQEVISISDVDTLKRRGKSKN